MTPATENAAFRFPMTFPRWVPDCMMPKHQPASKAGAVRLGRLRRGPLIGIVQPLQVGKERGTSWVLDDRGKDILADTDPKPGPKAAVLKTSSRHDIAGVTTAPGADPPSVGYPLLFPPAVARAVTDHYARATRILEYGSGGSTVLAASQGKPVISVESDKSWANDVRETLAGISDQAKVHYADIGPTEEWGAPRGKGAFRRFPSYALSVWDREDLGEPDLVLIDGRFRAACLVAVLLRAKKPTTVLFDDYANRPYYHAVERLAVKEELIDRMARFTVTPGPIPDDMTTQAIGWFIDPR